MKNYQSYQTGIETTHIRHKEVSQATYQSYQTGIETEWKVEAFDCYGTINRTKLELKQEIEKANVQQGNYQSYQTGIETDCWDYNMYQALQLSIVPNWN